MEQSRGVGAERDEGLEFGGPLGAALIILGSHALLLYLWVAWRFHDGALYVPDASTWGHLVTEGAPTWKALGIYVGFLALQAALAVSMPGLKVMGLPNPARGGERLEYDVNGTSAWYVTLILVAVGHASGVFPLQTLVDEFGPLLTVAMLVGDLVALGVYVGARLSGNIDRPLVNAVYDLFMGVWLNPRLGRLDLKMWSEIRVAWILLFLLTASAAAHQYATYGQISTPMAFMVVAHGLYTNACMKGEECIPTTWDIFQEKWGWMLVFWNFAGVPFAYCFNAMYLAHRAPFEHSLPYTVGCFALLFGSYYVWDTAQSQRNRFRMKQRGTFVKRNAFPQLPWGTLEEPKFLVTASGSTLLVDGWWRYARKIHYTADVGMALSWGLICGFDHFLPFFYVTFFVAMITHRARRDVERCKRKYGADWDRYCEVVPWQFVPYVI